MVQTRLARIKDAVVQENNEAAAEAAVASTAAAGDASGLGTEAAEDEVIPAPFLHAPSQDTPA